MTSTTPPAANTVVVEVLNLLTFEWIAYPFVGSRPGFTGVEAPSGDTVWIANGGVRFPQRS